MKPCCPATWPPLPWEPRDARGFFALLAAVASREFPGPALKGQLSGPVTFAGVIKDAAGKPILYDRELTQAVCPGLARKAAWQAAEFRELGKDPVIFFDEPYLTGFGSAYLPISRERCWKSWARPWKRPGRPPPVPSPWGFTAAATPTGPCCWRLPIDILSFDSYGYFDSLRLYDQALPKYLARGGWLAWGLVPTGEELQQETTDSLWQRFQEQVTQLAADQKLGLKEILSQALLTPACGMGYLSPDDARRVLDHPEGVERPGPGVAGLPSYGKRAGSDAKNVRSLEAAHLITRESYQGRKDYMKVKEVMVKEVATLDVNDELSLANDIMRLGRIRHLPVVDGTRLVGIVSERDLFRSSLAQALGYASKDTRDLMKTLRIKDIMVTGVITIPPETEFCEATKIMMDEKIGCLPVVEENRLVGLITETDILMQYLKECAKK